MKLTEQEKTKRKEARKAARLAAKEAARIELEKNQPRVKSITINIEWRKSRTWGNNPHAETLVEYWDGVFSRIDGFTCSGCGYDKESTVISNIFDSFLKYKLWSLDEFDADWRASHGSNYQEPIRPYGINVYDRGRCYADGIGTSCYYAISEYIGGKFEHVDSGKAFDVYKYTDKGF